MINIVAYNKGSIKTIRLSIIVVPEDTISLDVDDFSYKCKEQDIYIFKVNQTAYTELNITFKY